MFFIQVSIAKQELLLYHSKILKKKYIISSGKKGMGEHIGSEQTPRGKHIIRAKIGKNLPYNTVFIGRRPTGEIYTPELAEKHPKRDWILTRIFWLSGLEVGKNRLENVDTMRRFIYIHGTPDENVMGIPASHGCIRMRNADIIELFDIVPCYTCISIDECK